MRMAAAMMRDRFIGVAMSVKVRGTIGMPMHMKMYALGPQPPQHAGAKPDQHDANRGFKRPGQIFGNCMTNKDRYAGEYKKCQRVTKPPSQAMFNDIADMRAASRYARHRCDMVGLQRMLHAKQKSQPQNSEH